MFPASMIDSKDPISEKKMLMKDGQWRVEKGLISWTFEGVDKTMVSEEDKIKTILTTLKDWSQSNKGIPFLEFQKDICKVQRASKGIPAVKALFTMINGVFSIRPEPKTVLIRKKQQACKIHRRVLNPPA